jgi:acetyl esterase/lipase
VDLTMSGESIRRNSWRDAGLSARWVARSARLYRGERDAGLPEISPLAGDLAGLPPVHLQVAGDDILLSEGELLADRLREAGVELDFRRYPGLWHDFQLAAGALAEADAAIADLGAAIARALRPAG